MKQKMMFFAAGASAFLLTALSGEGWAASFIAAAAGAFSVYFIPVLRAKRKEKIRNRSYDLDLPDFMIYIAMFLEAGLNIWDAVERAAGVGRPDRPLYKDINDIFERVRKGSAKDLMTAFEDAAARRNSVSFRNFCAMLIQNVRKGSGELSALFAAQAQIYRNERRRIAGKLGDEAVTLLLIPSAIVLAALILLLLAPAIMEIFGGM